MVCCEMQNSRLQQGAVGLRSVLGTTNRKRARVDLVQSVVVKNSENGPSNNIQEMLGGGRHV